MTQERPRFDYPFVWTIDGEALFVRDSGAGMPFVFVHAWALSSRMWQYQVQAVVAAGARAVAFDRRGHGRSTPARNGYDLDTFAADLASVLEALELREVVLVGHSAGAAEVVRYLALHGSARVAKVVLIAPQTPIIERRADHPEGVAPEYLRQIETAWTRDFPGWVEANKEPFFTPETSRAQMDWLVAELLATPLDVAVSASRAFNTADLRADLARIDRPTLVIHGDRDASVPPSCGERTAAGIRHAELSVYAGAPHGLFVTHLDQLNADLLRFAGCPIGEL